MTKFFSIFMTGLQSHDSTLRFMREQNQGSEGIKY